MIEINVMKRLLFLLAGLAFTSLVSTSSILAVSPKKETLEVPEVTGDYAEPTRPGYRVHVFVHEPKEENSNRPQSSSELSCTDNNSLAVVGTTGWKLPATVNYKLNLNSAPSAIGAANFQALAGIAYNTWQGATNGHLSFQNAGTTTTSRNALDYQNIVSWGRTSGRALGVTYTRYNSSTGMVVDVDTILNQKFPWTWASAPACGNPNSYDAQDILTHELGHWLGLDDEYTANFVDNTMYGYGDKGEVKKDTLTTGDATTAASLYQ